MENIQVYFKAERAESLAFLAIGFLAFAAGIYFVVSVKRPFYMGIAWPLIIIALVQLFVGGTVFIRFSFFVDTQLTIPYTPATEKQFPI